MPGPGALRQLSDTALVSTIADWARATAAADARQLAGIAELVRRRCVDEHPDWACDDWDACAAELSCALTVGHGRASRQMDLAVTLRDRLPKVGALFMAGELPIRTVQTIARRAALVTDDDALAALDSEVADHAVRWGPLSQYKLEQAVDAAVERHDPAAVRRTRTALRGRNFTIGDPDDTSGTTSVWGRLSTPDAALLDQAIKALAHSVCEDDPRTLAQRRADAIGALAAHATRLACECGDPACPTGTGPDAVAARFVIHILAQADALTATPDPRIHGDGDTGDSGGDGGGGEGDDGPDPDGPNAPDGPDASPPDGPGGGPEPDPTGPGPGPGSDNPDPHPKPAPARPQPQRPAAGLIPGMLGGLVPAPLLAELIARGTPVRFIGAPDTEPEKRYRPSTKLDAFVRARDLTCRHPGCDRPAIYADIDHTNPWPTGPTHPSNTKCYCRKHHLVKSFWPGWTDQQLPDGTVLISTPSGHTYTTKPAAALLFPTWNTTTTALPTPPTAPPPTPARTLAMPTRKQTRAKARAYRIHTERALNDTHVAERNIPPPI